jgi:hypothetical protein
MPRVTLPQAAARARVSACRLELDGRDIVRPTLEWRCRAKPH